MKVYNLTTGLLSCANILSIAIDAGAGAGTLKDMAKTLAHALTPIAISRNCLNPLDTQCFLWNVMLSEEGLDVMQSVFTYFLGPQLAEKLVKALPVLVSLNEDAPVIIDFITAPQGCITTVNLNDVYQTGVHANVLPDQMQQNGSVAYQFSVTNTGLNPIYDVWLGLDIYRQQQAAETLIKVENTFTPVVDPETQHKGRIKFSTVQIGSSTYTQTDDPHYVPITLRPGETAVFTSDTYTFTQTNNASYPQYQLGPYTYGLAVWQGGYPGETEGGMPVSHPVNKMDFTDVLGRDSIYKVPLFIYDGVSPNPPGTLTAMDNNVSVGLKWGNSLSGDVLKYRIMRSGYQISEIPYLKNAFTDDSVQPGQTYAYQVIAIDYENKLSSPTNTVTLTVNSPPAIQAGTLNQYNASGVAVAVGATLPTNTVQMKATVTDPDADQVILEVEMQPLGTPFTNVANAVSGQAASGSTLVTITNGLASGSYHWQARVLDEKGAATTWASFGNNAETAADFVVGTTNTPPASPTLLNQYSSDGAAISVGGTTIGGSVLLKGLVSDPDGNAVKLEAEIKLVGTAFSNVPNYSGDFVQSGTTASLSISGLATGNYHWQARAKDSNPSNNVSGWSSFGGNAESSTDFMVPSDNQAPAPPDLTNAYGFGQFLFDSTTPLDHGGTVQNANAIVIKAGIGDVGVPPNVDQVRLEVEVRKTSDPFTGTPNFVGPFINGGPSQPAVLQVIGLTDGSYGWRARTMDARGATSNWVNYYGTSDTDFVIQYTNYPPPAPSDLQQYSSGALVPKGGTITSGTIEVEAYVSDPDNNDVKLELEVKPNGTAFDGLNTYSDVAFASSGSYLSQTASGFANGYYHWRVRAVDSRGMAGPWAVYGGNPDFVQSYADTVRTVCSSGCMYDSVASAIQAAQPNDEIRVAQGNYCILSYGTCSHIQVHDKTFKLIGGYKDNTFADRDPKAYETIISPMQIKNGTVTIDGFTIANGSCTYGGGIETESYDSGDNTKVTVRNCLVKQNRASDGGGISIEAANGTSATALLENNIIRDNTSSGPGAGVYAYAKSGGNVTLTLKNNVLRGNQSSYHAGGIYLAIGSSASHLTANIYGNVVAKNSAVQDGGAICATGSGTNSQMVINSVNNAYVFNHTNGYKGAAIYIDPAYNSNGSIKYILANFTNDILKLNDGSLNGQYQLALNGNTDTTIQYMDFDTAATYINGSNSRLLIPTPSSIINADPQFKDVLEDDYRLQTGSPLIEKGTNTGAPTPDMDGHVRPFDGNLDGYAVADIGAYEYIPALQPVTGGDVTDIVISNAANAQNNPSVAWAAGKFMATWEDLRNLSTTGKDIYGQRLDSAGILLGSPAALSADADLQEEAVVTANLLTNMFLATWWDNPHDRFAAKTVDPATGNPSSAVLISPAAQGSVPCHQNAFNPLIAKLLVVYEHNGPNGDDIYGRLANGNGTPQGNPFLISVNSGTYPNTGVGPAVSADTNNGRFLVLYQRGDNDRLMAQVVSSTGTLPVSGKQITSESLVGNWETLKAVAFNSSNATYLAVYVLNGKLYSQVLDKDASPVGSRIQVSDSAAVSPVNPNLTYDEILQRFLLVWQDGRNQASTGTDIYGLFLTPGGAPDGAVFPICSATGDQTRPRTAYDPTTQSFMVVWNDFRTPGDQDVYGALIRGSASLTVRANPTLGGSASFSQDGLIITGTAPGVQRRLYKRGTLVDTTANPAEGYEFGYYSGDAFGEINPNTLYLDASKDVTANYYDKVPITIASTPSGQLVSIDGAYYLTPATVYKTPGTDLYLDAPSPQIVQSGQRQTFLSWSNGGPAQQTIIASCFAITYTVAFKTQYYLQALVSPVGAGSVTATPSSSDGFYDQGASVLITAVPGNNVVFDGWTGTACPGTSPCTVALDGPKAVTALMHYGPPPTVPDGISGTAMKASRAVPDGSAVQLMWDTTCGAAGYKVICGGGSALPTVQGGTYTPMGSVCGIGKVSQIQWPGVPDAAADSKRFIWWVVVATDGSGNEGSWGRNSAGQERNGPGPGGSSGLCSATGKDLSSSCGR
jgi:predicted outer membrane repeat protein